MPISDSLDREIRTAAFIHVRRMLEIRDPLTSEDLARGFPFRGERIPLINPQRGIFRPKQMKSLLSIKTVMPRKGAKVWYDDQRAAHDQIYQGAETIEYSFMGDDPYRYEGGRLGRCKSHPIERSFSLAARRRTREQRCLNH